MLRKNADVKFSVNGSNLTASVAGEIDHYGASEIRTAIDGKITEVRPEKFILELSEVRFMDSSGLGLILGRYNKALALSAEFSVKDPSDAVKKILNTVGAEKLIKFEYSDEKTKEKL